MRLYRRGDDLPECTSTLLTGHPMPGLLPKYFFQQVFHRALNKSSHGLAPRGCAAAAYCADAATAWALRLGGHLSACQNPTGHQKLLGEISQDGTLAWLIQQGQVG